MPEAAPATLRFEQDFKDAEPLFALINAAYEVEFGTEGVSFKNTGRFEDAGEVRALLEVERCIAARDAETGALVGAIVYHMAEGRAHFGPFAVDPRVKARGVGKALLAELEATAVAAGCTHLEMQVIQHRHDILPIYARWGFVQTGTAPYTETWKVTRPCHFLLHEKRIGPAAAAAGAAPVVAEERAAVSS
jgi:GNAT superfamily N-acetyltransferase